MTSSSRSAFEEDRRQFVFGQLEYWRQVRESGGFDLENISGPQGATGMLTFNTEREDVGHPYPDRVKRYARFGLHRYNKSQGTQLELHHVKKFNMTTTFRAAYFITLSALDPATTSLVTLQIGVSEGSHSDRRCCLKLTCFIAKLQGAPSDHPIQLPHHMSGRADDFQFPYWPSDFNDSQRFHKIMESDNDWIRLYLELTLCSNDRRIEESELAQLQILKVAIETIRTNEHVVANIYITFKGFALARVGELGEHVERKVIVTRVINELTGCMTLLGGYGFSFGEEVAKQRYISRPTCNITNLRRSSEIPSKGPPLAGIFSRKVSSNASS